MIIFVRPAALRVMACAFSLAVFFSTFTPWASAATAITVMSRDPAERWEPLLDQFTAENPDISIEYMLVGGGQESQRIIVLSAGGVPPDVALWMLPNQYIELAHNGLLADITREVDPEFLADFYDGPIHFATYRGRLYGLPVVNGTMGILYNQNLFEESGLGAIPLEYSWDEFLTYARRTTLDRNGDGTPDVWGFSLYQYLRDYANFVWGNGGEILSEDMTRFAMTSPEAVEALQWLADLALVHQVSPTVDLYAQKAAWNYWYEGLAGMYPVGSWGIGGSRSRNQFDWDVAPFPTQRRFAAVNEPFFAAVTSGSKNIEASLRFLKWLTHSETAQTYVSAIGLGIPARRSIAEAVYDDPATPQDESIFLKILNSGLPRFMPYTANWSSIQNVIAGQMSKVFAGEMPAQQAMEEIAPVVNALLQELQEADRN